MSNKDLRGNKYPIDSIWIDRRFGLEVKIISVVSHLDNRLYKIKYINSDITDSHYNDYMNKYFIESTKASRLLYIDSKPKDEFHLLHWNGLSNDLMRLETDGSSLRGKSFEWIIIDEVGDWTVVKDPIEGAE